MDHVVNMNDFLHCWYIPVFMQVFASRILCSNTRLFLAGYRSQHKLLKDILSQHLYLRCIPDQFNFHNWKNEYLLNRILTYGNKIWLFQSENLVRIFVRGGKSHLVWDSEWCYSVAYTEYAPPSNPVRKFSKRWVRNKPRKTNNNFHFKNQFRSKRIHWRQQILDA